jgi:hypothetical protein
MQIIIACGSMNFGPNTPSCKSLGGSETAALMLAKALGARGHDVAMFCNLPAPNEPDFVPSGEKIDGVRWVSISNYQQFAQVNECDLLIAVRDPNLVAIPAQAKKKVLWAHDIFTKRGMKQALDQMQFTFDEIWCVSEWHRAQIIEATGYPERARDRAAQRHCRVCRPPRYATLQQANPLCCASRARAGEPYSPWRHHGTAP